MGKSVAPRFRASQRPLGLFLLSLTVLPAVALSAAGQPPLKPPAIEEVEIPLWEPEISIDISPETTVLTEPLRADGYVDYLAALNDHFRQGATAENNAMVGYLQAFGPGYYSEPALAALSEELGVEPPLAEGEYYVLSHDYLKSLELPEQEAKELEDQFYAAFDYGTPCWLPAEHPHVAVWLDDNEAPLERIAAASRRSHMYRPLVSTSEDGGLVGNVLFSVDYLQHDRDVVRAFTARARLRAGSGDMQGALDDLATARRLARHVGVSPGELNWLVGQAMDSIILLSEQQVFSHTPLTLKQAQWYRQQLEDLPPRRTLAEVYDLDERYTALDAVGLIHRQGPEMLVALSGNIAKLKHSRRWTPIFVAADWNVVMQNVNSHYDQLVESLNNGDYEKTRDALERQRDRVSDVALASRFPRSLFYYCISKPLAEAFADLIAAVLVDTLASPSAYLNEMEARAEVNAELPILAAALAEHRAATGEYPGTLEDLVPAYLPGIPRDPFTDDPFVYRRTEKGFLLYSLWNNQIDDGGEFELEVGYPGDLGFEINHGE